MLSGKSPCWNSQVAHLLPASAALMLICTSRREVCHNVPGLDSLYRCPDQGPDEARDDTMGSTPLPTLLMAGLLVAGLVTLALLAWALYSYLSQVSNIYI